MTSDVAVIGAGPYGLSVAAHIADKTKRISVFGTPMQTWRTQMPSGMRLKSEGFASTLYDPKGEFPLAKFCQERGLPYADIGLPVKRSIFADYGQEFARRYVPSLEDRTLVSLRQTGAGFELEMADGKIEQAKKVVCAVGITHYAYVAPPLDHLPPELMSHSSLHHDLSVFAGQRVAVVGGGASAADCAAELAMAGAHTHLLTRRPALRFHTPPKPRTLKDKIQRPMSTIGPGWKSRLCTDMPLMFHAMPESFRVDVTRRYLGPAPCWFIREQVETSVTVHPNVQITSARAEDGHAVLDFSCPEGTGTLEVDHILAATGYRVDLSKLRFLDGATRGQIKTAAGAPALSPWFESTIPGLFFVGPSAANSFGPLLRFACGAEFTSKRMARKLH